MRTSRNSYYIVARLSYKKVSTVLLCNLIDLALQKNKNVCSKPKDLGCWVISVEGFLCTPGMLSWPAVVRRCASGSLSTLFDRRSFKNLELPVASLLRKDRSPKRPRLAACSLFPEKETLRCGWYSESCDSRVVKESLNKKPRLVLELSGVHRWAAGDQFLGFVGLERNWK